MLPQKWLENDCRDWIHFASHLLLWTTVASAENLRNANTHPSREAVSGMVAQQSKQLIEPSEVADSTANSQRATSNEQQLLTTPRNAFIEEHVSGQGSRTRCPVTIRLLSYLNR
eukprot:Protomagalhaensia_wolfi_Nauph_80__671@NODE_1384_length_1554_cov_24_955776_g1070_i0_p1_GENE_NODE_1384_length_1554_cov_24_955776_g1070_i0NODE_1384_length_1554_cov_24_955776_g1070_i0_p1_ORF_typecomplete_len114_score7_32YbgS/PF13985_6/0_0053_NODE_1384_length_1554_cov_24_955776_g1070_i09111252